MAFFDLIKNHEERLNTAHKIIAPFANMQISPKSSPTIEYIVTILLTGTLEIIICFFVVRVFIAYSCVDGFKARLFNSFRIIFLF